MFKSKLFFSLAIIISLQTFAQDFQNAGDYITYITKANEALSEKYISYLSGVSHGKSARKVEKRRQEVLNSIYEARANMQGLPPFQGDRSLKDSTVAYYKILVNVFNEDYGKIVNMEEIAEQSYDAMEAYMLAQKKANEKLEDASKAQHDTQKEFAKRHNVNLIEEQTTVGAKMKLANTIMGHYDEVYLIFFKSYKQEGYLMEATKKKDIVSIEQNISALQKFAEEGMSKLKDIKAYNNDPTLIVACKGLLSFYKEEAAKSNIITDFFLKEENFNKIKKSFDSQSSSRRTQQDIDQYNQAVKDINAAVKNYNDQNKEFNNDRNRVINDWNNASKDFLDRYMPERR
jgi:hypothetical protein